MPPILLWFRQDLRIRDNSALAAAMETGRPILPVFINDPDAEDGWAPGGASRVFLHHALLSLSANLAEHRLVLLFRTGASEKILDQLASETGATGIYWNRRYEPAVTRRDSEIKKALREKGLEAESFNSSLLFEPWEVATKEGKPFQVFTPFWRNAGSRKAPSPVTVDLRKLRRPEVQPDAGPIEALNLLPDHSWGPKIARNWDISEDAAARMLESFLEERARSYADDRNIPAIEGTSRLSAYLHWGLIGPRQIHARTVEAGLDQCKGGTTFLSELGWREFAHHVLYHFPNTPKQPLREKFSDFSWEEDETVLRRWHRGETGYPIVDAGMRQLWAEGWMHNRVRMIVGSLLVKHLLHSWNHGARWFWDCLVDADLASNTLGWQWSGGCGADAAPYFRVFNPMIQGAKFDPEGTYVKRHVPELEKLPANCVHQPWEAGSTVLAESGVRLGRDYPMPIIDHKIGRERALAAFEKVKG